MIDWEVYNLKFSSVIKKEELLSSIRFDLYIAERRSKIKVFFNLLRSILKIPFFRTKKPIKLIKKKYDNIYFMDDASPSCLDNLLSLLSSDKKDYLVIVNNVVEKSPLFKEIMDKIEYLNFESFILFKFKYLLSTFRLSFVLSKKINCNFLNVFNSVLSYFLLKKVIERILSNCSAKNIFLSNDHLLPSNLVVHIGREYGLEDYVLQHGLLTKFYFPLTTKNFVVWGDKPKEWLRSKNIESNILPWGAPRFDLIMNAKAKADELKNNFYNKYGVEKNKNIFLYMSHSHAIEYGKELHYKNLSALIRVIENEDYQLVIKLHPSEKRAIFKEVFKTHIDRVILLPNEANLYDSIVASKICASAYSTTLIESMCLGVPTLQMNMSKEKNLRDYSVKEGCIPITNIGQLDEVLEKTNFVKELERQNKFINLFFNNLGNASVTIHNNLFSKEF